MNTLRPYLSNTDTFVMSTLGSVALMSTVIKGFDCTRESKHSLKNGGEELPVSYFTASLSVSD